MPLYNKARFVARAVESVRAQTHDDWTLTVVDDGSTDGGADIILALGDSRIRVLRSTRGGPGMARNIGLRANTAPWVALLDADDAWEPDFLGRTHGVAVRNPDLVAVFTDRAPFGAPARALPLREGRLDDYFATRMRFRVGMSPSSVLLHRERMLAVGAFREDFSYAEDIEAWFRLVCAGPAYFIPEVLCRVETGDAASITRSLDADAKVAGLQHLLDSYASHLAAGRIPASQVRGCRRFMRHQRARLAIHLAHAGSPGAALGLLLRHVPPSRDSWRAYASCVRGVLSGRGDFAGTAAADGAD